MISHGDHNDSTSCATFKHNLSLDDFAASYHGAGMPTPAEEMGIRIKIVRSSRGLSQVDLADGIGVGQTTVSSWERGRTECGREWTSRIAQFLRVPLSDIEGADGPRPEQLRFKEVPLISWVSAGRLGDPGDLVNMSGERLLIADLPSGEYFATEVRGDSMDRISPETSRLIVNAADRDPKPGKYYIFSLRGEATYKRFESDPVVRLEPFSTNPANRPLYPKRDTDWSVIGRVVRSYIDMR